MSNMDCNLVSLLMYLIPTFPLSTHPNMCRHAYSHNSVSSYPWRAECTKLYKYLIFTSLYLLLHQTWTLGIVINSYFAKFIVSTFFFICSPTWPMADISQLIIVQFVETWPMINKQVYTHCHPFVLKWM